MTDDRDRAPSSPWDALLLGAFVGVIGALLTISDLPTWVPYAVMCVGGTLLGVGVVGAGVAMGMVRAEWLIRRDRD